MEKIRNINKTERQNINSKANELNNILANNKIQKKDIIELTGIYNFEDIEETNIKELPEGIIGISIIGKDFVIERHIDIPNKCIYNKTLDTQKCKKMSGVKICINQIEKAKKMGFEKIYNYAAGNYHNIGEEGKNIGFYIWPRIGFLQDEKNKNFNNSKQINTIIENGPEYIKKLKKLNNILTLTDDAGKRIGLEFRKEHGCGFQAVFDLNEDSACFKILNEYRKEKQKKTQNP